MTAISLTAIRILVGMIVLIGIFSPGALLLLAYAKWGWPAPLIGLGALACFIHLRINEEDKWEGRDAD